MGLSKPSFINLVHSFVVLVPLCPMLRLELMPSWPMTRRKDEEEEKKADEKKEGMKESSFKTTSRCTLPQVFWQRDNGRHIFLVVRPRNNLSSLASLKKKRRAALELLPS